MQKMLNMIVSALLAISFALPADAGRPYGSSRNAHAPLSVSGSISWGGVLLTGKAEIKVEKDGALVPVETVDAIVFDPASNNLCIRVNDACYNLPIEEDRLARLASFVHHRGKGVFTAYPPSATVARDQQLEDCVSPGGGWCIVEFAGDEELEHAVRALDFPLARAYPENKVDALLKQLNRGVPVAGRIHDCDYEVSDISPTVVRASLASGAVNLTGRLHRFIREIVDPAARGTGSHCAELTAAEAASVGATGKVRVTEVDELLLLSEIQRGERGDSLLAELSPDELEEAVELCKSRERVIAEGLDPEVCVDLQVSLQREAAAIKYQGIGLRVARQVALLRTLREDHPTAWNEFVKGFFTPAIDP